MFLQPNLIQCECQWLQCLLSVFRLQFTLPHRDAVPAHLCQSLLLLNVSLLVSPNLRNPEFTISIGNLAAFRIIHYPFSIIHLWLCHIMTMPETPIHENARPVLLQHQIRMSRQLRRVKPISESSIPQPLAHNHLRLRVLRTYRRHILVNPLWRKLRHITLPISP